MTAKEFLRQHEDCQRRIQSKQRRIERCKEQAASIAVTLSERVQSSGSGDTMAQAIESYMDMQTELAADILRYRHIQHEVESAINAITDSKQREVLERYYLEGMTFEQVAVDLHYSFKQVCRIHGMALLSIKDVLECPIPPVV